MPIKISTCLQCHQEIYYDPDANKWRHTDTSLQHDPRYFPMRAEYDKVLNELMGINHDYQKHIYDGILESYGGRPNYFKEFEYEPQTLPGPRNLAPENIFHDPNNETSIFGIKVVTTRYLPDDEYIAPKKWRRRKFSPPYRAKVLHLYTRNSTAIYMMGAGGGGGSGRAKGVGATMVMSPGTLTAMQDKLLGLPK